MRSEEPPASTRHAPVALPLRRTLRRRDMVGFTVCALVGLDTLGAVAAAGAEGFTWLVLLALLFCVPYALVMAEMGSAFPQEGGPYEWTKLAFGRRWAALAAVFYWITNPFWVGGSLAFIATAAWSRNVHPIAAGSAADYGFKLAFVWISIGVAIVALEHGKWISNVGAVLRAVVLAFFSLTVVAYARVHGVHGYDVHAFTPTIAGCLALVPILLFNYVGFELENGAAEEMVDPQRDVPVSVFQSAVAGTLLYCVPVFGIMAVLPPAEISGIGGFMDAVATTFRVYGGAAAPLRAAMTIAFVFALLTSGSVWMIGSDRVQAVAAADGAWWPWFGAFSRRFGTPVRVNVLSGCVATVFCVAAIAVFHGGTDGAFRIVLNIAISTTLLSYLVIFPALVKLRYSHPRVERPYRVPFGMPGAWLFASVITLWVALGAWETIAPGTLARLVGATPRSFEVAWGVSRLEFELLTTGTLAAVVALALGGHALAERLARRRRSGRILTACVVLAAAVVVPSARAGAASPVIAVIKSSTLPPFEQATHAIVETLRHDPLQPEVLTFDLAGDERNGVDVLGRVHAARASVIVTVGSLATATATAHAREPVIFSMVLYPEQSGFAATAGHPVSGASLDIPVDLQFRYLRRLLPTAKRVGVLFDPAETGAVIEAAKTAAPKHGFTLVAKALDDKTNAVDAFETLIQQVDLVWAVADSHVFTPQTTSALVLATLRQRVPLIGLSSAHVRAGALAALYCNYDDIGKQTAETALRVLRGENAGEIPISSPRAIGLALNLHTAEHLGVQVPPELQSEAGEVVR